MVWISASHEVDLSTSVCPYHIFKVRKCRGLVYLILVKIARLICKVMLDPILLSENMTDGRIESSATQFPEDPEFYCA